ncbi:uncharacterized protein LOC119081544 [Bradysia coprophila]|uniref:uncharacterized protein LOC119081544 n=1 Tax=Bradysia coprophila TaxID=38358 RepID=UPI00187D8D2D|nr:uncharacterized protein LOC119081544 [Bradysia coprophila]
MDITYIFVIVIMLYFCVVFPLQLRRYVRIRRERLNSQRPTTRNHITYRRNVIQQNNNHISSEEQSDHRFLFNVSNTSPGTESQRDDAAARYLEAEHRQQIIDIQREIEQQAIRRREERNASNNANSDDPAAVYSQQIIDLQREIEQQAILRREEQRSDAYTPHMPPRLINSSTIRTSIFTITPNSTMGTSNSNVNYPHAPPLTPDGGRETYIHFANRSNSKDDELPSYDQAVAFKSTTESVTISRY